MKKVSEILDFFRLNNCEVQYNEGFKSREDIFAIWSTISKRYIFEGNEYQLREFYSKVNN